MNQFKMLNNKKIKLKRCKKLKKHLRIHKKGQGY